MAQPPLPPGVLQASVDAVAEYGGITAAAKALGVKRDTLQGRHDKAKAQGYKPGQHHTQTAVSGAGDGRTVSATTDKDIRTLDQLIAACDIDTDEWAVDRYVCNKWGEQWQVKAWLSRRVHVLTAREELEALKRAAPKVGRIVAKPKVPPADASYLLELSPVDFHLGKLAWDDETRGENYDATIAERLFREAMGTLVQRTKGYRFSRVLVVLGNDMFHIDSRAGTTTAGTQMDYDGRYPRNFIVMRKLAVWLLTWLAQEVAPVTCLIVPGNHDQMSAWHLGDSLECWFKDEPSVTIDNAPTQRKYYEHGKVMLLFTHGDKGKRSDYPLLMATEEPEMFGRTAYREIHTGHFHQTKVEEKHGIRVRILPSLTSEDAWHSDNHYTGNIRASEAFVWHPSMGLVGTALYTVPRGA